MSKRTPTYQSNNEVNPMCSDCKFRTSWAFIRECNSCGSYLCNICSRSLCKRCNNKSK